MARWIKAAAGVLAAGLAACGPEGPSICLNELVASNGAGLQDETGAFPDWVELHNATDRTLSLADLTISDDVSDPDKHWPDASLEVPAGGHLVLFADGDVDDGPLHLPFKLSAGGEALVILRWDGGIGEVLDSLEFGVQPPDTALARLPDGLGEWQPDATPTPGEANGEHG